MAYSSTLHLGLSHDVGTTIKNLCARHIYTDKDKSGKKEATLKNHLVLMPMD